MFTGVITALVTPFRRDKLDEEALRRLVDEQIAGGRRRAGPGRDDGRVAHARPTRSTCGSSRWSSRRREKRVPVIAGTGSNSTREAIEMSDAAKRVGADGLLLVTPYYNRPGQDHLYRHFKAVIEAAPLPSVLYNVPGRTACDLLPETIARLAELPEVVGVKEATGSALRAAQIIARVGDRAGGAVGRRRHRVPALRAGRPRGHLRRQQRRARADERDVGRGRRGRLEQGARSCTTGSCRSARGCSSRPTRSRSRRRWR